MPANSQNLVVLIDSMKGPYYSCQKVGNMYLNRFCIDEDAAFELSELRYLVIPKTYRGIIKGMGLFGFKTKSLCLNEYNTWL